jgi:hypothetical protein
MARFRDLSHVSECMRLRRACASRMPAKNAPVAQLDRALDYESRGQEFESLRARHFFAKARCNNLPAHIPALLLAGMPKALHGCRE